MRRRSAVHPARRQAGIALISGLLMLLVLMLLAMSMFRSVNLQERIAGSTREKQRAFQAAQSALQYGESWLGNNHWSAGTTCSASPTAVLAQIQVCSNALAAPVTTLPWSPRVEYQPPGMWAGSGSNTTTDTIDYYAKPGLYISYAGLSSDGTAMLFNLTAYAYGADVNDVAVVQSTYAVTSNQPRDFTAP